MKKEFEELVEILHICRSNCPWTSRQTIESYAKEAFSEAEEMVKAVEKKDHENLKEELGDMLWDTLMIAHIAEQQGLFTAKEIMQSIVEKIKRRKPYLFEGRKVTIEEAGRIWEEVKAKEKLSAGKRNGC